MGVDINQGASQLAQLFSQPEQPSESAPEPEVSAGQPETVEAESYDDVEMSESETEYDDDSEETPQSDTEPEETKYTVKVNGEESEVSLDELRKGYMMEADYRRKTSEVARIREEQQAKLNDLEAKILDASSMLQSELEDLNSAEMQDLKELDPQAFYEKKEKIESKALKLKQLQEHSQRAQLEARQAEVEKQKELLFQQLPEWLDQDTLKRESVMVNKLWDDYGFSPEELNSFTDHRMVLISLDAAKFREAKNAKPANKKIQPKPKSATPSTSTTKEQRQAKKANEIRSKVKKTGKMHDAGRAIADLLR